MKRILVTGGAGFVGSHLCRRLLKENNEVICLDNYFTGHKRNIVDMLGNPYFEVVRHDVTQPYYAEVDQIYNLACPASPPKYQYDPVGTVLTNVLGSINLLNLAKKLKIKILQASTSEIYGDPLEHPQKESYYGNVDPISVRSCYDEGKRCSETLFFDYKRQYKLNVKIVRIFNTYGPRMAADDGRIISNFINQALQGEDITIYGDGSQTRSFCYVDDLVGGLILMMNSAKEVCGPINMGNPDEYNIIEVAKKILLMTNSKSKIIFKELPSGDPKKRKPEIKLAKNKLNWEPKIGFNRGLEETINYFKQS